MTSTGISNENNKSAKDNLDKAVQVFSEYLKINKHRKTPERFSILKEIYKYKGHFDVDSLYFVMKSNKYQVSRATLYNTIELLLDCKLLIKHQFGEKFAVYEQTFDSSHHEHFICIECNSITEFSDSRLDNIEKEIAQHLQAETFRHSFYIFGKCQDCKSGVKQKNKK